MADKLDVALPALASELEMISGVEGAHVYKHFAGSTDAVDIA